MKSYAKRVGLLPSPRKKFISSFTFQNGVLINLLFISLGSGRVCTKKLSLRGIQTMETFQQHLKINSRRKNLRSREFKCRSRIKKEPNQILPRQTEQWLQSTQCQNHLSNQKTVAAFKNNLFEKKTVKQCVLCSSTHQSTDWTKRTNQCRSFSFFNMQNYECVNTTSILLTIICELNKFEEFETDTRFR